MRFVKILSILLVAEALIFARFGDQIMHRLALIWPASLLSTLQAQSLAIVNQIHENNAAGRVVTYVIGASNAHHFWDAAATLPETRRRHIVPLTSGSQVLPDAIRIIENIEVPGTTVVLGISPHKFSNMWFDRTMIETRFMNGVAGKFLLPSREFEALWARYSDGQDLEGSPWMQDGWQRFDPLIPAAQLMRDMMSENGERLNDQLQTLALPGAPATRGAKAKDGPNTPDASETVADEPRIAAALPDEPGDACAYRQGRSDHRDKISDVKYEQFLVWRDFSLTQMAESVAKSFDMLEFIIDLARARGIEVVVAEAPVPPVEDYELLPYIPDYTRLLQDLLDRRRDIRVITFPRNGNDQRWFADYVHLNEAGRQHYRNYLLEPFAHVGEGDPVIRPTRITTTGERLADSWTPPPRFVPDEKAVAAGETIPTVDWYGPDVVTTGRADFSRPDLVQTAGIPSQTFTDEAPFQQLAIGDLDVAARLFVDTLDAVPFELCPVRGREDGESVLYDLRGPDGRAAEYLTLTGTVAPGAIGRVKMARSDAASATPPPSPWNGVPVFPAYVGYAFTPESWADLARASALIADDSIVGSVPFGPASVDFLDLPTFHGFDHAWVALEHVVDARVMGRTTRRTYAAGKLPEVVGGAPAPIGELALPGVTSALTGGKIASYGLEIVVDGVRDVVAVDEELSRIVPTTLTPELSKEDPSTRERHYTVSPTAPHALGLVMADGGHRSLNVGGADLVTVRLNPRSGRAVISLALYDAAMRQTFGEDATPEKIKAETAADGTLHLRLKRSRRNLAITDVVPGGKLFLGLSDEPALTFATLHKGGARASLSMIEHADYQELDNDRQIHYGNQEGRIVPGEGLLGNRIPYTKSVFAVGEPFAWNLPLEGLELPFVQPTVERSPAFAAHLDALVASGDIEIAAHSPGTPPDANEPEAVTRAMTLLRDRYGGRLWTDHGGIPTNILYYGWDRTEPRFYIVDRLAEQDVNYIWSGPDIYVPTRCVEKADGGGCNRGELLLDNQNIAPNGLLYDLPMLDPGLDDDWMPRFFRSTFLSVAAPRDGIASGASMKRPPNAKEIDDLIASGRSVVYHVYFGKMLRYRLDEGGKKTALPDYINETFAHMAEARDRGDLYIGTVTDHLDHVRAVQAVAASAVDGQLHLVNGGETAEQATIIVLPYDDHSLLAGSATKLVLDVAPGVTVKTIEELGKDAKTTNAGF